MVPCKSNLSVYYKVWKYMYMYKEVSGHIHTCIYMNMSSYVHVCVG